MENNILELTNKKSINLDKNMELEISQNLVDFKKILSNVASSGADYVIKSLDCSSDIKSTLNDAKKVFKTGDFDNLLKTALNASLKIGFEVAKNKIPILRTLDGVKDISIKGGLGDMIASTVDIVANNYLKGNLISDTIKKFFNDFREFFKSNLFVQKLDQTINRLNNRINKFKDTCSKWYEAYEKFDIKEINQISENLKKEFSKVCNNIECVKENQIIQNMTELINNKMDKLSKTQMEICASI